MKNRIWFVLILMLCLTDITAQQAGQNQTCETAAPFCTGTLYSFPAGVNSGTGQPGPNYGCLTTRPNPAWYYMRVANPGNIIIQMYSTPAKDIDYCCWGPFSTQFCCGELTANKIVSCSYSTAATEICNIPNGQTGEYYMLVITNYSNQPCNITFQQTGGSGTTDCTILPPPCTSNSPVCNGQTIQLAAQAVGNATYNWWGPAGFNSTLQNPTIPNATTANSGQYSLRIIVNGQPSADTSHTYVHVYKPVANAGADTTIMNGVSTTLHGRCTGGSGSYRYKWAPSSKLLNDSVQNPQTVNLFSTTVFTLTVTDDSANCQSVDNMTVAVEGGALAVNAIATPAAVCHGATSQLQAIGTGGAGNYNYQWTGPGGFSSTLPNPVVSPVATSEYQVTASDGYNTVQGAVTVNVIALPLADAGTSKSIPFGTYTFLSGSVVSGSGNYFYSWSPADKLINAGVQTPQTINLSATTVYSLTVTDLNTNCISNNEALVTVEVTGGPLNVNPVATPNAVCRGDSTRLHASAGGGNVGYYSYAWSSDPSGFTSSLPDPVVKPLINTTYSVTVTDEYNQTSGTTEVTIHPNPYIYLGPSDTTICIYDSIILDAGNEGAAYLWSNGAITRTISFGTTGIGFDAQHYDVEVVNPFGCRSTSGINVFFSLDYCVGVDENNLARQIRYYPNPAGNEITIDVKDLSGNIGVSVFSAVGKKVREHAVTVRPGENKISMIDLRGLASGVYLIRFSGQGFSYVNKLMIE